MENSPKSRPVFPPLMNMLDTYTDYEDDPAVEVSKSTSKKKKTKKKKSKFLTPIKKDLTKLGDERIFPGGNEKVILTSITPTRITPSRGKFDGTFDNSNYLLVSPPPHKPTTPGPFSHPTQQQQQRGPASRSSPRAGRKLVVSTEKLLASQQPNLTIIPNITKTDTSFQKAVESIAALKLHNYAMKRRQHIVQKIKVSLTSLASVILVNSSNLYDAPNISLFSY
jgi:hypothetical protein